MLHVCFGVVIFVWHGKQLSTREENMKPVIILLSILAIIPIKSWSLTKSEMVDRLNILAEEIETLKSNSGRSNDKLSIGGYGEVTFSKNEEGQKNSTSSDAKSDSKRFVLYVGYQYSSEWSFVGELEIEHANEAWIEQAYVQYSKSDLLNYRFGTLLLPVGHTNLYHEANTFESVQRPQTETAIIPTTWRENGVGLYGKKNRFEYHAYVVSSVSSDLSSDGLRGGRQKASKADSHHGAYILSADYLVLANLKLGASYYNGRVNGTTSGASVNLSEIHGLYSFSNWEVRFLTASAVIDKAEEFNLEQGQDLAEKMYGSYLELKYKYALGGNQKIIPFVRYERLDTHAQVDDNTVRDQSKDKTYKVVGLAYKPMEQLALKADYAKVENKADSAADEWNLGVAWQF